MIFKNVAKEIFSRTFGNKLFFDYFLSKSLCVFNYHDVTYTPSLFSKSFGLNIYPDLFGEQLRIIKKLFYIITPDELLVGNFPRPAALITFDDGFNSYFKNAVPIMAPLKIPSIVFLNMEPVEGGVFWGALVAYLNYYDKEFKKFLIEIKTPGDYIKNNAYLIYEKDLVVKYLELHIDKQRLYEKVKSYYGPFATIKDLEACSENSYVYFGNHLYNHYNAKILSDFELKIFYLMNQEKINKFPNLTKLFSFPFGQPGSCYLPKHIEIIKKAGAKAVFSACPLPNYKQSPFFYHRIGMSSYVSSDSKLISFLMYSLIRNLDKLSEGRNCSKHLRK